MISYSRRCPGLNTLIDFRYAQHFKAQRGHGGAGKNRTGGGACKDLVVKVPLGTQDASTMTRKRCSRILPNPASASIMIEGGMGGRGNASYKTSTNRAPRQHQPGDGGTRRCGSGCGSSCWPIPGLVGMPNAGKSTFINQLANTNAKVGDYPFTTLRPQLGVVRHRLTASSCWPTFPA